MTAQSPRRILRLSGADTRDFLQGLITNDIKKLETGLVYAAILTPQGKYIADFFLKSDGADVLLDADAKQADALIQRLSMYKLRADVQIEATDLHLHRGTESCPQDGSLDPRVAALGWRAYRAAPAVDDETDWIKLAVQHVVPTAAIELNSDSFILENGFERLNGVDFRKGCYVGQEVTARMKHKTQLRKGLVQVRVEGSAEIGSQITANGKAVGTLFSQSGGLGLAYLRFDRAGLNMVADGAHVRWENTAQ